MSYDPSIHHRHSIRLKGYDYAQCGLYFITICVQGRDCLLGNVANGVMVPNDAGRMVGRWYGELENKFPNIRCHAMVVMPNHFHCILEIVRENVSFTDNVNLDGNVGADLRVCPDNIEQRVCPNNDNAILGGHVDETLMGTHVGVPLQAVVGWFKTMTTNEYIRGVKNDGWKPFYGKLWQRNYYEHIIRNEKSYHNISEYIINNPSKWDADKFNPQN